MAEAFIKTFKRDYVRMHELPDSITVMEQLPIWFEDNNENYQHKGLKMMSPREYKYLWKGLMNAGFNRGNFKLKENNF